MSEKEQVTEAEQQWDVREAAREWVAADSAYSEADKARNCAAIRAKEAWDERQAIEAQLGKHLPAGKSVIELLGDSVLVVDVKDKKRSYATVNKIKVVRGW